MEDGPEVMEELKSDAVHQHDLNTIGGRIRWARAQAGMTQQDVALVMFNDPSKRSSIAQYEARNNAPIEAIRGIAAATGQDPSFIAFGGNPNLRVPNGVRIPVIHRAELECETAVLPPSILTAFTHHSQSAVSPELHVLKVDAPLFSARKNSFILVDATDRMLAADSRIYVVMTSAGVGLVRCEVELSASSTGELRLTSGQGVEYLEHTDRITILGRPLAIFSAL